MNCLNVIQSQTFAQIENPGMNLDDVDWVLVNQLLLSLPNLQDLDLSRT
jgi:hypothetical protein